MFRFAVCLTMVGMAMATGFVPTALQTSKYGLVSGGSYQYGAAVAKPALATNYQLSSAQTGSASFPAYSSSFFSSGPKLQTYDYTGGPIIAAVTTHHKYSMYDAPSQYAAPAPLNIEVPSSAPTVNFLMKSKSSNINVENLHEGQSGGVKETSSEDEPFINRHTVLRPVIQEVREIITPYRRVEQRINPVEEHIETIVPRGQAYAQEYTATALKPALSQTVALNQGTLETVQGVTQGQTTGNWKSYGEYGLTDFSGAAYKPLK